MSIPEGVEWSKKADLRKVENVMKTEPKVKSIDSNTVNLVDSNMLQLLPLFVII